MCLEKIITDFAKISFKKKSNNENLDLIKSLNKINLTFVSFQSLLL